MGRATIPEAIRIVGAKKVTFFAPQQNKFTFLRDFCLGAYVSVNNVVDFSLSNP